MNYAILFIIAAVNTSNPPALEYNDISLGQSRADIESQRELTCQPMRFDATWCKAETQGDERRLFIWFYRDIVSRVRVLLRKKAFKPNDYFYDIFTEQFGEPRIDKESQVSREYNRSRFMRTLYWKTPHPGNIQIHAFKKSKNDDKSHQFRIIMTLDNGVVSAMMAWQRDGRRLPR